MLIHEMSEAECRTALTRSGFGRLACARDNQPYVVPVYFAYDGEHIYGFTTLGQKTEWMRSNPLVCLEIDDRTCHEKWVSIIVHGRYEELLDEPARVRAHDLLQRRAMWWEPAYVATAHGSKPTSLTPIFYRIHVNQMTGHRATPDRAEHMEPSTRASSAKRSWWSSIRRTKLAASPDEGVKTGTR